MYLCSKTKELVICAKHSIKSTNVLHHGLNQVYMSQYTCRNNVVTQPGPQLELPS